MRLCASIKEPGFKHRSFLSIKNRVKTFFYKALANAFNGAHGHLITLPNLFIGEPFSIAVGCKKNIGSFDNYSLRIPFADNGS